MRRINQIFIAFKEEFVKISIFSDYNVVSLYFEVYTLVRGLGLTG